MASKQYQVPALDAVVLPLVVVLGASVVGFRAVLEGRGQRLATNVGGPITSPVTVRLKP